MKTTIQANTGYRVRYNKDKTKAIVFDGDFAIMAVKNVSYDEFVSEEKDNECFVLCEVFETVEGNKFVYFRDDEINADYIAKIPTERRDD